MRYFLQDIENEIYSLVLAVLLLPPLLSPPFLLLLGTWYRFAVDFRGKFARSPICTLVRNIDDHNADIKVKVFLCTAKINTQKLNTAERAHALQILTIYCLPISLTAVSLSLVTVARREKVP